MVAFVILGYTSYLRYFDCGGFCDTTRRLGVSLSQAIATRPTAHRRGGLLAQRPDRPISCSATRFGPDAGYKKLTAA